MTAEIKGNVRIWDASKNAMVYLCDCPNVRPTAEQMRSWLADGQAHLDESCNRVSVDLFGSERCKVTYTAAGDYQVWRDGECLFAADAKGAIDPISVMDSNN